MKKKKAQQLMELLESRFPWLAFTPEEGESDLDVSGADTVQELCDWYEELKACIKS